MTREIRPFEVVIALVVLGVFAFYMLQWGMEGIIHGRQARVVPDLRKRSVDAALDSLAPLSLGLRKEATEFDASVPVASILRQTPPAGTVVREGKIVRVVTSRGGETVFVPAITGLPMRNAEMLLRQGQLRLGEVSEAYSLRLEKGMVLAQEPKAEASAERGSVIAVTVSAGTPPAGVVLMPDFLRKNIEEASAWAAANSVALNASKDKASLFPGGVILQQQPAPDTVLSPESKVTLVVSGRPASSRKEGPTEKTFHYELSQGTAESLVRIVVTDQYGERELFNGFRRPGSKIDIPIQETGGARVKIFLNGILVEERDL